MAEGILQELSGELVRVDSKWYKVLQPQYVPKEMGIKISFSTEDSDPGTIKFIKAFVAGESKPASKTYSKPYVKKAYGAPVAEKAPSTSPTSAPTKQTGYGSAEDVKGKEVGCAIGAAAEILSGSQEATSVILVKMKQLVEGILAISKEFKAK
jgi:hypothetical protein